MSSHSDWAIIAQSASLDALALRAVEQADRAWMMRQFDLRLLAGSRTLIRQSHDLLAEIDLVLKRYQRSARAENHRLDPDSTA